MKFVSYRITGLLLILSFLFCGCSKQSYKKSTQLLMGTFVEVVSDDSRAGPIAFAEIKRLDNLLSKFNAQSEIYKLNQTGKSKISPDTLSVIKKSIQIYKQSNGAFDITVAPLVDIWKEVIHTKILPQEDRVSTAKALVGSENIFIDEKKSMVKFLKKGMRIDLGAIAKGYAVDCAVKKLQQAGIRSCLVNIGGNMYGLGKKGKHCWKVGIRHPRKKNQIVGYILLCDQAIATSGDYEQYAQIKGKRIGHIINPKTGYPVNNNIVSVTVISPSATNCDALGTAIFVLGKENGLKLSERYLKTQTIILTKEDLNV
ncbi:MAG: FAD:protein FMN transferase [Candidatus Omnitrophota bacterium]|nr:FAD:protein FMN transferase [Candidatus Omnitrophota bacterium]